MATFDIHSLFGVDMLGVSFRKLTPAFLNSPRTELSGSAIDYYHEYFEGDSGNRVNYDGSFTFSSDDTGSVVDVQGRISAYDVFEWESISVSFESDWTGFSVSGFDLDLDTFENTAAIPLLRSILRTDDVVGGDSGADRLYGFSGNDEIRGWGGGDWMQGGPGDDTLVGGNQDDTYYVEDAGDVVVELGHTGSGKDTVRSKVDFELPENVEHLVLLGGAARGVGNALANAITGNAGGDILQGGDGADTVSGGHGADRLNGGGGSDVLSGNAGADVFVYQAASDSTFAKADRITDFGTGADLIGLAAMDADATAAGSQHFTFIGRAAFDPFAAAGELRFVYDSATDMGLLLGSTDMDPDAEFMLQLPGVSRLVLADLIL